jgi:hypothetical protein
MGICAIIIIGEVLLLSVEEPRIPGRKRGKGAPTEYLSHCFIHIFTRTWTRRNKSPNFFRIYSTNLFPL